MQPETVNSRASELATNSKITVRISELRQPVIAKLQVTQEKVIRGFQEAFEIARETSQPSAMTGAYRVIGKMSELYPAERSKVDMSMNGALAIGDMSIEEVRAEIARLQ
jgi:hypothetical protein